MGVSVTIEGLEELLRDASEADRALSDGMRKAVASGVEEGAQEARTVHRWKNRTGKLEASIAGRVEVSAPGGATGVIEATAPYASYLEEGTLAHPIEAKNYKYLHWVDKDGNGHFAKKVRHPGTDPSPFLGPAYLKAERVIEREIDVACEKASDIMSR